MVAWKIKLFTPEYAEGREVLLLDDYEFAFDLLALNKILYISDHSNCK